MFKLKLCIFTVLAFAFYWMNASAQSCSGLKVTADTLKGCPPLLVKFSAVGAPAGSTYTWNFGSGFVPANDTTYKIFTAPGKHGVQVNIQLPNGSTCQLNLKDSIEVLPALSPQISVSPGKIICNGSSKRVTLTDNTPGVISREWIIDGVKYPNGNKSITYTFNSTGYKSVSLKVTNAYGCTSIASDNKFIQIYDSAEVDFCANISQTRQETKAKYTPYFNGPGRTASTYTWSFPGGSPSSYSGKTPPEVTYSNPTGVYDVILSITTADGCTYTSVRKKVIQPYITWPKDSVCINEVVNAPVLGKPVGSGYYQFNLPGSIPLAPLAYMPVNYNSSGYFDYSFTFKYKEFGCQSSVTLPKYIKVLGPGASFFSLDNVKCSTKDSVHFYNNSKVTGLSNVTFQWKIFDSLGKILPGTPYTTTSTKTFAYQFTKNGLYNVRLVAKSTNGCSDSLTREKYVSIRKPKADFSLDTNRICLGKSVGLKNLTTPVEDPANPYDNLWIIQHADSTAILAVINVKQPDNFIPPALGKYHVTLIVSTSKSCTDTMKKYYAFEVVGVKGDFTINKTTGCAPNSARVAVDYSKFKKYPNTPFNVLKYKWETVPEQGVFITQPDREFTDIYFTDPGCYKIYLNIYDAEACTSQFVKKGNTICLGVRAIFDIDTNQCLGTPVPVNNFSELEPDEFKWSAEPSAYAKFVPSDTSEFPSVVFSKDTCYTVKLIASKGGCRDTMEKKICPKVSKADFTTPPIALQCAPVIVSFENTSTGAHDYIWDFGDGTIIRSTNKQVYHVYNYNNPNGYRVKLVAIDTVRNCTDTISKSNFIKIIGPAPSFKLDKRKGCDSITVTFTNTSVNTPKFLLDYDDGSPFDTSSKSTHTYKVDNGSSDSTVYYPVMIATDTSVCKKIPYWQDTIIVYRSAKAKFVADVSSGCPPLTVTFTDQATNAMKRYWDLDGDSIIDDSTNNPVFIYTKPGSYTVKEVVENAFGCKDSIVQTAFINVLAVPEAAFGMSSKKICGTGKITFSNKSKNQSYSILDYGDGSAKDSVIFKPHTYTFDNSSAFDSIVFYPVIKSYNSDCFSSDTDTVVVYRTPVPGFYADTLSGCDPLSVKFHDTSKYAFTREWDFNNDGVSDDTARNPVYVFKGGKHTIKLSAIGAGGCKEVLVQNDLIDVNELPVIAIEASDTLICVKETVQFTDKSTSGAGIVKWLWKFDEPNAATDTSSEQNPAFTFFTAGYHNISLTVWDGKGCSDTKTFKAVFVEDSLPPVNTTLSYVTVVDSAEIEIHWVKNTINDFKEYNLRRSGIPDETVFTSTNVDDIEFTEINPLINANLQPYCYDIQTTDRCDNISGRSQSHCTVHLQASPFSGNINKLEWTPYIGWNSVKEYIIYRSEAGKAFTKLATVAGTELSYLDTNLCDLVYSYYVEASHPAEISIISRSNKASSKPNYILQDKPIRLNYTTVKDDNLLNISWNAGIQTNIKQYHLDRFNESQGTFEKYTSTNITSFTDNNVDVHKNSYAYRVSVEDMCGNISPYSNLGKSILLQNTNDKDRIFLSWTAYKDWPEGIDHYSVQLQKRNKEFVTLAFTTDSFYTVDTTFNEIDTAYCFRVMAVSKAQLTDTSISNISCAVLPSRFYVPNAFTPNTDDLNEVWKPAALSIYNLTGQELLDYNLKIFDRWGSLVFETNNLFQGWDGTKKGKRMGEGVYLYMIRAQGIDKVTHNINGNITLIR